MQGTKFVQMWFPSRKLPAQKVLEAMSGRGDPRNEDRLDMKEVLAVSFHPLTL